MKEVNVIGTMQLLAACQKAADGAQARRQVVLDGLRRLAQGPGAVHRGHGAARAAALRLRQGLRRGRGLRPRVLPPPPRRRRHDAAVRELPRPQRPTPLLGRTSSCPSIPTRARLRPADAVRPRGRRSSRCSGCARSSDHPGTYNVAGDGVLLLSQAARRARQADAAPAALRAVQLAGGLGAATSADRLLAGAAVVPDVRPGRRHDPAARARRVRPRVLDGGDVRRLRPRAGTSRAAIAARPARGARGTRARVLALARQ